MKNEDQQKNGMSPVIAGLAGAAVGAAAVALMSDKNKKKIKDTATKLLDKSETLASEGKKTYTKVKKIVDSAKNDLP